MTDEEPFLPAGTVIVDLEGVDADLGLVIGQGSHIVEKRVRIVARTVVIGRGASEGRRRGRGVGPGQNQGRQHAQEESEHQHRVERRR